MRFKQLICETPEEDRIISILSREIADYYYNELAHKIFDYKTGKTRIDDYYQIGYVGNFMTLHEREMFSPLFTRAALFVSTEPDNAHAIMHALGYKSKTSPIDKDFPTAGYFPAIEIKAEWTKNTTQAELASIVAHELRHLLDYAKSKGRLYVSRKKDRPGRYVRPKVKDQGEYTSYLSRPDEINARVMQAQEELEKVINKYPVKDKALIELIGHALRKHRVLEVLPKGKESKEYRRILNRILRYLQS